MLHLHEGYGLAAIRECGLYDHFLQLIGDCTQLQRVSDRDGNILFAVEGDQSDPPPKISRHALIRLLSSLAD